MIKRSHRGNAIIELPIVLFLTFVLLMMPMLGLASVTLRSALMAACVQNGVFFASKAKTFEQGTTDKPAAVVLAKDQIIAAAAKFSGLTVDSINTQIVITRISNGTITRSQTKLAQPADTSANIYQIESVVQGRIAPLLPLNPQAIGKIPGLSVPIVVAYSAKQMSEAPQGLNQ